MFSGFLMDKSCLESVTIKIFLYRISPLSMCHDILRGHDVATSFIHTASPLKEGLQMTPPLPFADY